MENNNSKVGVIIAVHNNEEDVSECIQSVIDQTYPNIEIIIVNDGSTDNTLQICEKYRQIDPRIKLYSEKQHGVSYARNIGIQISTADYIMFIDGDDKVSATIVADLMSRLIADNSDIACCNAYRLDKNSTFYFFIDQDENGKKLLNGQFNPVKWLPVENVLYVCNTAWAKLYKKSLFNNIEFPLNHLAEDNLTLWKIFLQSNNISFIDKKDYCYKINNGSITNSIDNELMLNTNNAQAIQERIQFYYLLGIIDVKFLRDKYMGYLNNILCKENNMPFFKKDAVTKLAILKKYEEYHA